MLIVFISDARDTVVNENIQIHKTFFEKARDIICFNLMVHITNVADKLVFHRNNRCLVAVLVWRYIYYLINILTNMFSIKLTSLLPCPEINNTCTLNIFSQRQLTCIHPCKFCVEVELYSYIMHCDRI